MANDNSQINEGQRTEGSSGPDGSVSRNVPPDAVLDAASRIVRRLKCLLGMHEWEIIDPSPGWWTRGCKHCEEYQAYELVDIGRSKTWVRYHRPPNDQAQRRREQP